MNKHRPTQFKLVLGIELHDTEAVKIDKDFILDTVRVGTEALLFRLHKTKFKLRQENKEITGIGLN